MSPERQREIASRGGKAVKPESRAYSKNRDLAREAGSNGGRNVHDAKRGFAKGPTFAAEAGKKGGRLPGICWAGP
jgi:hypothetical protein